MIDVYEGGHGEEEGVQRGVRAEWERMEGESREAYRAFCVYRGCPPGVRTLDYAFGVFTKDRGDDLPVRAPVRWRGWSERYLWVERAVSYDVAVADARSRVVVVAAAAERVRWEGRASAGREEVYEAARKGLARASEVLERPVREKGESESGAWDVNAVTASRHGVWMMGKAAEVLERVCREGAIAAGAVEEAARAGLEEAAGLVPVHRYGPEYAGLEKLLAQLTPRARAGDPLAFEQAAKVFQMMCRLRGVEDGLQGAGEPTPWSASGGFIEVYVPRAQAAPPEIPRAVDHDPDSPH